MFKQWDFSNLTDISLAYSNIDRPKINGNKNHTHTHSFFFFFAINSSFLVFSSTASVVVPAPMWCLPTLAHFTVTLWTPYNSRQLGCSSWIASSRSLFTFLSSFTERESRSVTYEVNKSYMAANTSFSLCFLNPIKKLCRPIHHGNSTWPFTYHVNVH